MSETRYMISETAKKVDVEAHVLRYWEEELDLPIDRNEMGHRYYTEDDITLFRNIRELKDQGFQLKAIKMVLPDLCRKGGSDLDKLLAKKEELNRAVEGESGAGESGRLELSKRNTEEPAVDGGVKMQQFQMIISNIVLQALRENNQDLSEGISEKVSDSVLKEMDYLMRVREEREDERVKKLDETIRSTQRSRKEVAAAKVEARRMKKLQKKEKKKLFKITGLGRKKRQESE